jgi:hypothetical protein
MIERSNMKKSYFVVLLISLIINSVECMQGGQKSPQEITAQDNKEKKADQKSEILADEATLLLSFYLCGLI